MAKTITTKTPQYSPTHLLNRSFILTPKDKTRHVVAGPLDPSGKIANHKPLPAYSLLTSSAKQA
jgi:hypothetical protein